MLSTDSGKAKPPPRIIWNRKLQKSKSNSGSIENTLVKNKTTESIQNDSRTRLILVKDTHAAAQYNGLILQFTEDNPHPFYPTPHFATIFDLVGSQKYLSL